MAISPEFRIGQYRVDDHRIDASHFINKKHRELYLGNVNDDLHFEYEEETTVRYGCSATLHDEFWYFGGLDTTLRQV